ncbi:hypothetical protein [Sediminimonas qiaohouensis]|uniref:hypothetical protein n=1 Tax=Sediminimonas qiaohouensis TaxID=552061 RepID=UPI00040E06BB|nr:hypothetical protein [Sediminimonas qiaohouensis]
MTLPDIFDILLAWTPYMAEGFATNLSISALAMAVGGMLGLVLGVVRIGMDGAGRAAGRSATALCRNVPSFVLMFYLAAMLPREIVLLSGEAVPLPTWIKAAVALAVPVTGFLSDQIAGARRDGRPLFGAPVRFATLQYFMIIVMASATSSVIGADDLVARAARVAAITDVPGVLSWCYAYAALWFLTFGILFKAAVAQLSRHLAQRRTAARPATER